MPPLRERREDIPALATHLLNRIVDGQSYRIDPDAVTALTQHSWPGNVRELYHTLERALLVGNGHITAELLRSETGDVSSVNASASGAGQMAFPQNGGFKSAMQYAEKQLLVSALEACSGNKTAAAASLGMKPSTFRDKLAKHGLN